MRKTTGPSILPFMLGLSLLLHALIFLCVPRFSGGAAARPSAARSAPFSLVAVEEPREPPPAEPQAPPEPDEPEPRSDGEAPELAEIPAEIPAETPMEEPAAQAQDGEGFPEAAETPAALPAADTGVKAAPRRPPEGAPDDAAIRAYLAKNFSLIQRRIRERLRYPEGARRSGLRGSAELVFTIMSDGAVQDLRIARSSGEALLDEAALEAVSRAAPFPPPPGQFRISAPIVFRLR
jgi:protein TonB